VKHYKDAAVVADKKSISYFQALRDIGEGRIENIYRLQIMNTTEYPMRVEVSVSGRDELRDLKVRSGREYAGREHDSHEHSGVQTLTVPPVSTTMVPVRVRDHVDPVFQLPVARLVAVAASAACMPKRKTHKPIQHA
jgi:hypothetical protein